MGGTLQISKDQADAMGAPPEPPTGAAANADAAVQRCPPECLSENIILVGSEEHYDLFWLKMMFIAPAFAMVDRQLVLRPADRTTLAFCDKDYNYYEKLPLEYLKDEHGVHLLPFTSPGPVNDHVNQRPQGVKNGEPVKYLIQDVAIFSHGLPNTVTLDMSEWGLHTLEITKTTIRKWSPASFMKGARLYSYACRTGTAKLAEKFANDAEAAPENSLAQAIADYLRIDVHAFLTRTQFGPLLRDPKDSDRIEARMKEARKTQEGQVIAIPPDHEGLPHAGLDDDIFAGSHAAGTCNYALWRKRGATRMPFADDTPSGLSRDMRLFTPR